MTAPQSATGGSPAPWRDIFLEHVASMPSPIFTLATLHRGSSGSATGNPEIAPRARNVVFRGLWATLPDNVSNKAPRNPPIYDSDLPVLTTDARMEKMGEITGDDPGNDGGGPVEAVWWDEKHSTQWRMRGTVWALGPDADSDRKGPRGARAALLPRMRRIARQDEDSDHGDDKEANAQDWSWNREVTAHFGNLSPGMRGTFRNPPPGVPVTEQPEDGSGLGLGQTVDDIEDAVARKNFRVVVLVPTEVDRVDLSDAKRARKWVYTYRPRPARTTDPPQQGGEGAGEWEKVEVWP